MKQLPALQLFVLLLLSSTAYSAANITCGQTASVAGETYRLNGSCSINGSTAITINASNVTLDCQGNSITGNNTVGAYGINATSLSNITIQNCIIDAFGQGIRLTAVTDSVVNNTNISNNCTSCYGVYNEVSINCTYSNINITTYGSTSYPFYAISGRDQKVIGSLLNASGTTSYSYFRSTNNAVLNNSRSYATSSGWYGYADNGTVIENSTLHTYGASYSFSAQNNPGGVANLTIRNCTLTGASTSATRAYLNYARNTLFEGNSIGYTSGIALRIYDSTGVTVRNQFLNGTLSLLQNSNITMANLSTTPSLVITISSPYVDISNTSNSVLANSTIYSAGLGVLRLGYNGISCTGNTFYNNTLVGKGTTYVVQMFPNSSGNLLYWNNFTNISTGLYVNDTNGSNFYNSTEGNIWENVANGSIDIKGSANSTGFPSLYVGSSGSGYPYSNATSDGKIAGAATDFAPLTPTRVPDPSTPPEVLSASVLPSSPADTSNLFCNVHARDNDTSNFTVYFEWYLDGANQTALASSYANFANNSTLNVSMVGQGNTTQGQNWSCAALAYDGANSSAWLVSSNATIGPRPSQLFVSTAGNDTTGNGSESSPWRTLAYAVANAMDNEAIFIANGTYNETGVPPSGIAINVRLTIAAQSTLGATVAVNSSSANNTIYQNSTFLNITGIVFDCRLGMNSTRRAIYANPDASDNLFVSQNRFAGCNETISVPSGSGILENMSIAGNSFDNVTSGIYLSDAAIDNLTITDNSFNLSRYGIYLSYSAATARTILVNPIERNNFSSFDESASTKGVYLSVSGATAIVNSARVNNNSFGTPANPFVNGALYERMDGATFSNNTIYSSSTAATGYPIHIYGNGEIHDNTLGSADYPINGTASYMAYLQASDNLSFSRNTVYMGNGTYIVYGLVNGNTTIEYNNITTYGGITGGIRMSPNTNTSVANYTLRGNHFSSSNLSVSYGLYSGSDTYSALPQQFVGALIENNVVNATWQGAVMHSLFMASTTNSTYRNNVIISGEGASYGLLLKNNDNCDVYNNTVYYRTNMMTAKGDSNCRIHENHFIPNSPPATITVIRLARDETPDRNATNITYYSNTIDGIENVTYITISNAASSILVLNQTYDENAQAESTTAGTVLSREWYYRARVVNSATGLPISGASVYIRNSSNASVKSFTTDSEGYMDVTNLTEYVRLSGTRENISYIIAWNYSGVEDSKEFNISDNSLDDTLLLVLNADGTSTGGGSTPTATPSLSYSFNCSSGALSISASSSSSPIPGMGIRLHDATSGAFTFATTNSGGIALFSIGHSGDYSAQSMQTSSYSSASLSTFALTPCPSGQQNNQTPPSTPPSQNGTLPTQQNYTISQPNALSQQNQTQLPANQTPPATGTTRSQAQSAISSAEAAMQTALSQGRDTTASLKTLDAARQAFDAGNYAEAARLAASAQKQAAGASSSQDVNAAQKEGNKLSSAALASILFLSMGVVFYLYVLRKKKGGL